MTWEKQQKSTETASAFKVHRSWRNLQMAFFSDRSFNYVERLPVVRSFHTTIPLKLGSRQGKLLSECRNFLNKHIN